MMESEPRSGQVNVAPAHGLLEGIGDAPIDQSFFDRAVNRRGTDSDKWDWESRPGELPMTIADMDLRTSPAIVEALRRKVSRGIFGYELPGEDYYSAVTRWMRVHHGFAPRREWMQFVTGVIPAISSLVRSLSNPGDNVLVATPVYNIFYNSVLNNGRHVLASPLVYDRGTRSYSMDWEGFERKLTDPLTTLMILCNPHNPIGYVMEPEDLARIVRLASYHHVTVISDEVHGDLVLRGEDYTPILDLPEPLRHNTVELISPSKTFNVAALHSATALIADEGLRERAVRGFNQDEIAEPNLAALPGTIAAYTLSDNWHAALKRYLLGNVELVEAFLRENIPELVPVRLSATYLMWIDCGDLFEAYPAAEGATASGTAANAGTGVIPADQGDALSRPLGPSDALAGALRRETGLVLTPGRTYHEQAGDGGSGDFLRMALGCPRSQVRDGLERLKRGIDAWKAGRR